MPGDVIALADERVAEGTPLLIPVMRQGVRLSAGRSDLAAARERARQQQEALHPRLRALQSANPPYEMSLSKSLATQSERLRAELAAKTLA